MNVFFLVSITMCDEKHEQRINVKFLIKLKKKRPELWKHKSWILHQNNAPAHIALSVSHYLNARGISVLDYTPYALDLAQCDFLSLQRSNLS